MNGRAHALGGATLRSVSCTGLAHTGHNVSYTGFYEAIFQQGVLEGPPTAGKLKPFNSSNTFSCFVDNPRSFGDPALTLAVPTGGLYASKDCVAGRV
ncbi:hypothetical protein [Candidatus Amarolinea aalborgensis]|uniref:hypothetical protein n=1 Tax=Candidatus Amarolinea aalborgensis TaxID=2249329 RepID=UPI003BF99EC8